MRYENQHLSSGMGQILNAKGTKKINVFYVLYSAEAYAGSSRYPVRVPDELRVKEFDFRDKDRSKKLSEPTWVKREAATLRLADGKTYQIGWDGSVGWSISPSCESDVADGDGLAP